MMYDPKIHHRRSIRLKGYDYSQEGLYYVTICCQDKIHRFGNIENREMILNDAGKMVVSEWENLPVRFPHIILHDYVVMPDQFHAVLEISAGDCIDGCADDGNVHPNSDLGPAIAQDLGRQDLGRQDLGRQDLGRQDLGRQDLGRPQGTPVPQALGEILGAFKSIVTVNYIRGVKEGKYLPFHKKLWQRDYYEHIIRDEQSYQRLSAYIINNPRNG